MLVSYFRGGKKIGHIALFIGLFSIPILLLYGCKAYSFSGTNLNKKIKTFSIDSCDEKVAMGPADITDLLSHRITSTLIQRTQLSQQRSEGDVQFNFTIVSFKFSPTATQANNEDSIGSIQRLTIEVEVDYVNNYDEKKSFNKRKFSQFADASASADLDSEEPRLIEEIFEKLAYDVINATVADW